MKLITEQIEEVKVLVEEKEGKKSYFIEGVFLQSDITNRNNRVYPFNILEREVMKYNENYISQDRALGELGHPEGPSINLGGVSHKIVKLYPEDKNFVGRAKILETPMGKIAKNLLDDGVKLGVSSRGMGSIEQHNGFNVVKDDFMLSTAADIVADPSAPDAFVRGIMEGKEWVWDNGILKEQTIDRYFKSIKNSPVKQLEEQKLQVFKHFLSNL